MKYTSLVKGPVLMALLLVLFAVPVFSQAPNITSFVPANAGSGEQVTISGTNFSAITAVSFGATAAASFTIVSSTQITAVVGRGSGGNVSVTKTGFAAATRSGFTFSPIPTVTGIITDFGGFWKTNTTRNNPVFPDDAHNLLGFTYGGVNYATGVQNAALLANGVSYAATTFKALPAIMNGTTSGSSLYIMAASKIDGNASLALYTNPNIKDLTLQSVLSDGPNGLNLGTGYTNLPLGATSNFNINSIQIAKAGDNEPDLVITQIADPSNSAFDTYKFLDAAGNIVGNQLQIDLSKLAPLGTYYLDLFKVAPGIPFANAKPTDVGIQNTTRQIRLMAFKLSDFGITPANYAQVKKLQIVPSGVTDMAFVAYNTAAINVPPSVAIDSLATNAEICNPGGGSARLVVNATDAAGGTLTYGWEVSTDAGANWSSVTNSGIYSGATSSALEISSATVGYQYRATITESGSGYTATSDVFTIVAKTNTALAGTLNPAGFTNCVNAISGITSLFVAPTGGTGTYYYQWALSTNMAGPFTNIEGAIYANYSPPLNVAGTFYYQVTITSGCLNRTSATAVVVISGEQILSVTNNSRCSAGSVSLAATASGGITNWYAAASGGTSLATGASYNTPSIAATTTYYVSTQSGSCNSIRVPVMATIANTISLSAANFEIPFASNVCAGIGSTVTISSSVLMDDNYLVTYNISGSNPATGVTKTVTLTGGSGSFVTNALLNAGANTLTITGVQVNGCNLVPASGNTVNFLVNAGSPLVSNFVVSVANGCSNNAALATVTSNTLLSGTYVVTYNVSGTNNLTGEKSQLNFTAGTPGTGTFALPILDNVGSNNITVTGIALLSAPDCSSALAAASPTFVSNAAAAADAGNPLAICASDGAVNITTDASANNYASLVWSTNNGTGYFTNNTTAQALSATLYTPDAADIARGFVNIILTAAPNAGCVSVVKANVITINAAALGGTVTANQSIPAGTLPADLLLSGQTGSVVKWQKSLDASFTSPQDIAVTTTTLSGAVIGNLSANTYFRAVVQSGNCVPVFSASVIVTVSVVPVKLLYFTQSCTNNKVLLQWATSFEVNSNYFNIEKSNNGSQWQTIKKITAAGNSNSNKIYNFIDSSASASGNYFRLKQVDADGNFEYSSIVVSNCGAAEKEFAISPNPGKDIFKITELPENGLLRITDSKGSEVLAPISYNGNNYQINLGRFSAGVYYVSVYADGKWQTKKLYKK